VRIVVVVCLCVAASASAETRAERAAKLFEEGRQLSLVASFREACDRFARSYELDPAAGTALNFADCQEHLGHLSRAWQLFDAAATGSERTSNPLRAQYARDRANALLPRLATVVVRIADPRFDRLVLTIGDQTLPAAAEVHEHVEPGDVVVTVAAPERRFTSTVHTSAGATTSIDVPELGTPGVAAPPRDRRWVLATKLGAGTGAAAIAVGAIYGISAIRYYNQAFANGECFSTPTGARCTPDGLHAVDDAHSHADLATAFVAAGSALVAGSAIAYWLAPHGHAIEVSPTVAATSAGIVISGRF
jgi:tetratricopeptide (TPR) repeat protein